MGNTFKIGTIQVKRKELDPQVHPFNAKFDRAALPDYFENNIKHNLELIHQAGKRGAQVLCTGEDLKNAGFFLYFLDDPTLFDTSTETIPGPTSERLGALARKYNLYLTACYFEKSGSDFFNTAILINPQGKLQGKYRKVQIPGVESWRLQAGKEIPVFKTDFGNAGFLICYDIVFPEITQTLALKNVDLILHPTLGFGWTESLGEATVRCRCNDHSVSMVVSKNYGGYDKPGRSLICNQRGQIIADAGYEPDAIVFAEFDPREERNWAHGSFMHEAVGVESVRGRLFLERVPEMYQEICRPLAEVPLARRYSKERLLHTDPQALRRYYEKLKEKWTQEQARKD